MDIQNRSAILDRASHALSAAPTDPKKTLLIYAGVSALLSLVLTLILFVIDMQIDAAEGIRGMQTRSILSTVRTILSIGYGLFTLCWTLGYKVAALDMARQNPTDRHTLMGGFRRLSPLITSSLMKQLIYTGILLIGVQLSSMIFTMTPLSDPLYSVFEQMDVEVLLEAGLSSLTTGEVTNMIVAAIPLYAIIAMVTLALFLPFFYGFRMIDFRLADAPRQGGMAAIRVSKGLMRGNRIALFRLDLKFWWFYLAEGLLYLISNGALIASLLSISLPMAPNVAVILCFAVAAILRFVLYYFTLNKVQVSYAVAYDTLLSSYETPAV